jgi:flagellar hook-associated protein 3 FlgL
MNSGVLANLQASLQRVQGLQERLSSGKAVAKPSDSPEGTVAALRLRADIRRSEQLSRNADDGLGWLGTADNTLTSALDVVRRTRELVLQGINGATSTTDRAAMAAEVDQIKGSAVGLANTRYLDQPIFAGTAGVTDAYDVTGAYQGNTGTVARSVAENLEVQVNLVGTAVFGAPPSDLFTVIGDVADHLRTNPTALTADVARLDAAFARIQDGLAVVGARYHQVEAMRDRAEAGRVERTNTLSGVEDIDLPATIVDLQLQQTAYQTALGAAARVIQPSLVDFLK